MNWLTHIHLSRDDISYRLGNLLADVLKGPVWSGASDSFREGVTMHRAIDRFTDSHEIVSLSKSRLNREKGYLKGVVIDVLYDHFLSIHWDLYSDTPLGEFVDTFHRAALYASQSYPAQLRQFIEMLAASNRLATYGKFDGFVATLERMDQRLSDRVRRKECTADYVPAVKAAYDELEQDFLRFYPELAAHVERVIAEDGVPADLAPSP